MIASSTKLKEPGVYYNTPMSEYRTWPFLNPSLVKHVGESLKRFKHERDNPREDDSDISDTFAMGSAVDALLLEPDEFARKFVLWSGGRRAGKVWDQFCDANAGKVILRSEDYDKAVTMRDALRDHPAASALLNAKGRNQVSLVSDDPGTGLRTKGRPDRVNTDCIPDLKTSSTINDRLFTANACKFGYVTSAAAYQAMWEQITGECLPCKLIVVCTTPPHDVVVYSIPDDALAHHRKRWCSQLQRIKHAHETGNYPGVAEEEIPLMLPPWELPDDDGPVLTLGGKTVAF